MPTSTDLVTDLPADFEVFGQAVDTRLKALQPGTTLGDLAYSSSTANTNTRLGIGSTGQVLTVAGGVPTWATAPAATSMTVLASGNLATGTTTTTFNSISSAYLNLRLVIRGFNGSGNNTLTMRVNNDSGANYATYYSGYEANTTRSQGSIGNTSWNLTGGPFTGGSYSNLMVYDFADYANTTTRKLVNCQATFFDANGPATAIINATGGYSGTNAAISRIDITYGSNVNGGTYILYGVS